MMKVAVHATRTRLWLGPTSFFCTNYTRLQITARQAILLLVT